ncbi:MAG: Crp/Fnr family transcriptional regulator [Chitinophagaceae bacterium]|nr:MAG: Crp/Fnr family transcriptional regulator [Chitinophagaceae bacterium]
MPVNTLKNTSRKVLDHFIRYLGQYLDLSDEEKELFMTKCSVRSVKRGELLLKEGEHGKYKIFVAAGLLSLYCINEDGRIHIMRFAPENTWMIDHESYTNETPSKFNIEALENCEVVLFVKQDIVEIMQKIPAFAKLSEKLISASMDASQQRILMNISSTPEEKYNDFIARFPEVFERIPLHMVASYLGISRETLSRVRRY